MSWSDIDLTFDLAVVTLTYLVRAISQRLLVCEFDTWLGYFIAISVCMGNSQNIQSII